MSTSAERATGRDEDSRFRAAFYRIDSAALIVDAAGAVVAANHAAAERFGRELEGRNIDELSDGHSSGLLGDLKIAASGGVVTLRLRDAAGAMQRTGCRVAPLPGNGGSAFCYLVMLSAVRPMARTFETLGRELRDMREQRAHERRIQLDTEQRLRRVESFSHHAAHDLKTPLSQIDMVLDFFEEGYGSNLPVEGLDLIGQARRSSCRLQRLITDLLERAELGEAELTMVPLPLEDLVDEALQDLGPSIVEAGAIVRVARPLGAVEGDPVFARQILYNILSNAIKYRSEHRRLVIDIVAERGSDRVLELGILDNGRGFDATLAERIFDPFERVDESNVEGSGLGLANCRMLCDRLSWTIEASGRSGVGADFRIRFGPRRSLDGTLP